MSQLTGQPVHGLTAGPQPKHVQLRGILSHLISHDSAPGKPIPSERELMQEYGVSRSTVRKAIESLIGDGVLERAHGKGTFITRPRLESRLHLASFSQDMRRRGLTPSTRLLRVDAAVPPGDAGRTLGLARREKAWRIDRIRLANGQPIALESGWYSRTHLPGLDRQDLSGSLYELFAERYELTIDHAEQTLWSEAADDDDARLLDVPVGSPLLVFRRESMAGDLPIEHVVSRYRGDRYQLHMTLDQPRNGRNDP